MAEQSSDELGGTDHLTDFMAPGLCKAPGTSIAGSTPVIHWTALSAGSNGHGSQIAHSTGMTSPIGHGVGTFDATHPLSLMLAAAGPTRTLTQASTAAPTSPALVARKDAQIYDAQSFRRATAHETAAIELLGRSEPKSGPHTGCTMVLTPGSRARDRVTIDGQRRESCAKGDALYARLQGITADGGLDTRPGAAGRIDSALGDRQNHLHDAAGGSASDDFARASLTVSQPLEVIEISTLVGDAQDRDTTFSETGVGLADAQHGVAQRLTGAQGIAASAWYDGTVMPVFAAFPLVPSAPRLISIGGASSPGPVVARIRSGGPASSNITDKSRKLEQTPARSSDFASHFRARQPVRDRSARA